jgi:hypothetical protein
MELEWYQPRGTTPLFDAIGRLLSHIDASPLGADDSVDHVVAIITDGQENASSEFDRAKIFELIKERSDAGWVFIYLGSEPDSYSDADRVAVSHANSRKWDKSSDGTREMLENMSSSLSEHRMMSREKRRQSKDDFYRDGGDR